MFQIAYYFLKILHLGKSQFTTNYLSCYMDISKICQEGDGARGGGGGGGGCRAQIAPRIFSEANANYIPPKYIHWRGIQTLIPSPCIFLECWMHDVNVNNVFL